MLGSRQQYSVVRAPSSGVISRPFTQAQTELKQCSATLPSKSRARFVLTMPGCTQYVLTPVPAYTPMSARARMLCNVNKKLSYRRETARQLRMYAQLTRCFSAVAV